jgi:short coiled-coil protein
MQYDDFSVDERPTWGVRSPRDGGGDLGLVRETLKKEQVIKSVLNLSNFFSLGF